MKKERSVNDWKKEEKYFKKCLYLQIIWTHVLAKGWSWPAYSSFFRNYNHIAAWANPINSFCLKRYDFLLFRIIHFLCMNIDPKSQFHKNLGLRPRAHCLICEFLKALTGRFMVVLICVYPQTHKQKILKVSNRTNISWSVNWLISVGSEIFALFLWHVNALFVSLLHASSHLLSPLLSSFSFVTFLFPYSCP